MCVRRLSAPDLLNKNASELSLFGRYGLSNKKEDIMHDIMTRCPFCHSVVFIGTERCTCCGATIEYGRVPSRYFLLLLVIAWAIIGGVHILCDDIGLDDFLLQLTIASIFCLLIWLKAIRALNKKYKGRIRYRR